MFVFETGRVVDHPLLRVEWNCGLLRKAVGQWDHVPDQGGLQCFSSSAHGQRPCAAFGKASVPSRKPSRNALMPLHWRVGPSYHPENTFTLLFIVSQPSQFT